MPKQTMWLIRHAQSIANKGNWRAYDCSLSEFGCQQAEILGRLINEQPDLLIRSPLQRALETSQFILKRWPQTPVSIAPIEEFHYLSRNKLHLLNDKERLKKICDYWDAADPYYRDAEDAESFDCFMKRVYCFREETAPLTGFILVVGHGQFFKAYQLDLQRPYNASPEWMRWFRAQESTKPMKNCEIFPYER